MVFLRNVFILLSLLEDDLAERQLRWTGFFFFFHHLEDTMIALLLAFVAACGFYGGIVVKGYVLRSWPCR